MRHDISGSLQEEFVVDDDPFSIFSDFINWIIAIASRGENLLKGGIKGVNSVNRTVLIDDLDDVV